jgi:hypothetical protein
MSLKNGVNSIGSIIDYCFILLTKISNGILEPFRRLQRGRLYRTK